MKELIKLLKEKLNLDDKTLRAIITILLFNHNEDDEWKIGHENINPTRLYLYKNDRSAMIIAKTEHISISEHSYINVHDELDNHYVINQKDNTFGVASKCIINKNGEAIITSGIISQNGFVFYDELKTLDIDDALDRDKKSKIKPSHIEKFKKSAKSNPDALISYGLSSIIGYAYAEADSKNKKIVNQL